MNEIVAAVEITVRACYEIYQMYDTVKMLPDMSRSLVNRVQLFEPRLNLLLEGKPGPDNFDPLPHVKKLQEVLGEIKKYLKKLKHDSFKKKISNHLFHASLLSDYDKLNAKLDTCRDDLKFDMEFDLVAERAAVENETKGLLYCMIEHHEEHRQEQRTIREMLQGQWLMLMEVLRFVKGHEALGLRQQENAPAIEAASVLFGESNVASDFRTAVTDQIASECEISASERAVITDQIARQNEIPDSEIEDLDIVVGSGGYGVVNKAIYKNQDVVIKRPHVEDTDILDELLSQSRCSSSKFVASVFGFTVLNGFRSIVMEYAPCGSLASLLLAASGKDGNVSAQSVDSEHFEATLPVDAVIQLLHKIALGIEFIHQRRIIHRDIKPDNILLGHDLTPKLADFGSARELTDSASHVTGSFRGSIYYMAKEALEIMENGDGRYTYTVDQYSFGTVIVVLCHRLFGGQRYLHRSPRKDAVLPEEFPRLLTIIKDTCMSQNPSDRYGRGSASETLVSRALEQLLLPKAEGSDVGPLDSSGFRGFDVSGVANVARVFMENRLKRGGSKSYRALHSSSHSFSSPERPTAPFEDTTNEDSSSSSHTATTTNKNTEKPTSQQWADIEAQQETGPEEEDEEDTHREQKRRRREKKRRRRRRFILLGIVGAVAIAVPVAVTQSRDSDKPTPTQKQATEVVMQLDGLNTTFDDSDSELWTKATKLYVEDFYNRRRRRSLLRQSTSVVNIQEMETTLEVTATNVLQGEGGNDAALQVIYNQVVKYKFKGNDDVSIDNLVTKPFDTPDKRKDYTRDLRAADDVFGNLVGVREVVMMTTPNPTPLSETMSPTQHQASSRPTDNPSTPPTSHPTKSPTINTTVSPTRNPTESPTANPTHSPTGNPTIHPTLPPTPFPTRPPTPPPTPFTRPPTLPPTFGPVSVTFLETFRGLDDGSRFGVDVELSGDGNTLAVGAINKKTVVTYRKSGSRWNQLGQVLRERGSFGGRVALSRDGGVLIVGARSHEGGGGDTGQARVYRLNSDSKWVLYGSPINGFGSEDEFGWDVAISDTGRTIAVAARLGDPKGILDAGYVRVFQLSNNGWIPLGQVLEGESPFDSFGRSIALDSAGRRIAVGIVNGSNDVGRVRVYDYHENGRWYPVGQALDGDASEDFFGTSVALSTDGSILVVGADGNDTGGFNAGMVRVYQLMGDTWVQRGNPIYGQASYGQLGAGHVKLSYDGNLLVAGAQHFDSDRGAAYLFRYNGGTSQWDKVAEIRGDMYKDTFGDSVSLSGDGLHFLVGAPDNGNGYARLYRVEYR